MSAQIQAGQALIASTGQGGLNQYYGLADVTPATVTQAALTNLCTPYVIPAGEAYAGAAYEMSAAGNGVWGSTVQSLQFSMYLGGALGTAPTVGASLFNASQTFQWSLTMRLTCADGVNQWWAEIVGNLVNSSSTLLPGTAANNACPIAGINTGVRFAAVSGAKRTPVL